MGVEIGRLHQLHKFSALERSARVGMFSKLSKMAPAAEGLNPIPFQLIAVQS